MTAQKARAVRAPRITPHPAESASFVAKTPPKSVVSRQRHCSVARPHTREAGRRVLYKLETMCISMSWLPSIHQPVLSVHGPRPSPHSRCALSVVSSIVSLPLDDSGKKRARCGRCESDPRSNSCSLWVLVRERFGCFDVKHDQPSASKQGRAQQGPRGTAEARVSIQAVRWELVPPKRKTTV